MDGYAQNAPVLRRDWRTRLPFFYGWVIVGGSLFALRLTYSVMYSFSVFYVALLEQFGWAREAAGVCSAFVIVADSARWAQVGSRIASVRVE